MQYMHAVQVTASQLAMLTKMNARMKLPALAVQMRVWRRSFMLTGGLLSPSRTYMHIDVLTNETVCCILRFPALLFWIIDILLHGVSLQKGGYLNLLDDLPYSNYIKAYAQEFTITLWENELVIIASKCIAFVLLAAAAVVWHKRALSAQFAAAAWCVRYGVPFVVLIAYPYRNGLNWKGLNSDICTVSVDFKLIKQTRSF
jgi:hypothetical protein